jgi:hypothetical protein
MTPYSNLANNGLQNLPFLFPDATFLNSDYYAVSALNGLNPPFWDGTRMSKVPPFSWGNRVSNAPPNIGFPGWFNINRTQDFAISLTKIAGRHTLKAGFYNTYSFKAENVGVLSFGNINFQQDTVGTNTFDTSFGFANAAIGTFSSYQQAQRYVETSAVYRNTEAYIQDNWKVSNRLTLDYGLRFAHQAEQYDRLGQASNFVPDRWALAAAPRLYVAGCANGVYPCGTGVNRQAMNPITGQFLGPNSSLAIGTLVPDTGNTTNGIFLPGQAPLPETATFDAPAIVFGPRFGAAYDLTGRQSYVLRGGVGMFYDRPSSTQFSRGVNNPPTASTVTVRYGQLQNLGRGGLTTQGAPQLFAIPVDSKVPASVQWNVGMQVGLPWASSLDASYVGQHSYNTIDAVNINAVDFGAAFLPENQDRTLAVSATPGGSAISQNEMRGMRGYDSIQVLMNRGWRTYHSIQLSFRRRFQRGISLGFNDTISLYDRQQSGARLQHDAAGVYAFRADQGAAEALLGVNQPSTHIMRGTFVWDMPDLRGREGALRVASYVLNDWQLSGIWSGATGSGYTVGYSYQSGGSSQNLTGSPDYGARIRLVGDPGSGCSSDPYRQFTAEAFQGPLVGSDGLESGTGYVRGCFQSTLDFTIQRTIRLGGPRTMQLRVDLFNAPNSAIITGRNTSLSLNNPTDPVTIRNLPYDENGNLIDSRSRPRGAGVGVATNYQTPRRVQFHIRFSF